MVKEIFRVLAGLATLLLLGACSSAERHLLFSGSDSRIDRAKMEAYANEQASITAATIKAAGIPPEAATPQQYTGEQWWIFVLAGINYVDLQCNDYLGRSTGSIAPRIRPSSSLRSSGRRRWELWEP
jgi:hypothetical protein